MSHDERAPRQRLDAWVRAQLAADPSLGAHELTRRALEDFADDEEVLAMAARRAAGPPIVERRVERGDQPDPDWPGTGRRAADE